MSVSRFSDRYWPIYVFATSVRDACRKLDEYANGCPIEHPIDARMGGTGACVNRPGPVAPPNEQVKQDGP